MVCDSPGIKHWGKFALHDIETDAETFPQPSHRIFEKSAGTICLALPHGRDE
jgi:hypothetical protein